MFYEKAQMEMFSENGETSHLHKPKRFAKKATTRNVC